MHRNLCRVVFAILILSVGLWAADDAAIGTWKLNVAKSKYSPGPPPKSRIVQFQPYGEDGVKYTSDEVNAQGKLLHSEYTVKFDGKDYPIQGEEGNPPRDTVSARRIDRYTTVNTNKAGGKILFITTRVVSKDGKTMTVTVKGQGLQVNNVAVYEKQ